ncbi:MAG: protoporphyrinogen oxidase [Gemmatimonadales bacterium]|nr:protoporphyrinogen oxidase [Gemmatimonadota bacterium]MBP6444706.1 protoporphyrinogen oxidase [Gemmatimonadales bacterium]MBP6570003.1 protoporphyrinogen oxidase [Gemmatimonadales bacterium]MBP7621025.1 protoporphyrinogen oxidase [Gemmatimonadales bacterium]
MARIAIVGAGAAGLVAARRLQELGAEPLLFEAAPRVGGSIETVRRDGWLAEAGPNTIMEPDRDVRALLDRAGLADRIVHPGDAVRRRYIVHDGVPQVLPLSPGDLVATPILSVAGRLRMLKEPFVAKGRDDPEETVDAFARRRFGDEVASRLFDPLVAGTSGADPTQLLARFAFPKLVEYEQRGGSVLKGAVRSRSQARRRGEVLGGGLWSCRLGLEEITARLAMMLGAQVRSGVAVVRVAARGGGYTVQTADGTSTDVDGVVFACPATAFATLALDLPGGEAIRSLATIPHSSLVTVSLGYPRERVAHPLDGSGLLAPSCERRRILGALFPSTLFPERVPVNHVLLTAFAGGMRQPQVAEMADATVVEMARAELGDLLGVTREPAFCEVRRWRAALPIATSGHAARIAPAEALEADRSGLLFTGAWRAGLAVHEVMLGGLRAAERIIAAHP